MPPKAKASRKAAAKNGPSGQPPPPREHSPDDIKDLSLSAISVDLGKGNGADGIQAAFVAKEREVEELKKHVHNLMLALEASERDSAASQARAEALEVAGMHSDRRARELELDKQAFLKLTYDFEFLKNLLEEKEKRV